MRGKSASEDAQPRLTPVQGRTIAIQEQPCPGTLATGDEPSDPGRLLSIVGPGPVPKLLGIAVTSITDEGDQALHTIVASVGEYSRQSVPGL